VATTPIPAKFTVGAKVLIHFGPNRDKTREASIARVTKTLVITEDGERFHATIGSEDTGQLYRYGSTSMWPSTLTLAGPGE
jgi:hypothetical protein